MRQKDLKYFGDIQSGRMNSDDSPFALTTNEWVNAQNVRTGTTDKGVTGVVESIGGNVEIPEPANLASVAIGDQKWSLQNLSVTQYRDGSPIPLVSDPTAWAALTTGARCINPANGETFYNWYAVNDPRGLAPQGWWIPTLYEFQQLSNYLGGDGVSGGKLKEEGFVHWDSPNAGADNSSGFTALGSGYRDIAGDFQDDKLTARFWTATQYSPTSANTVLLRYDQGIYDTNLNIPNTAGYSVRVITFNSQYITIGSIEDTENNRFVYFDYDTDRSHLKSIPNITLLGTLLPGIDNSIFTFDIRASVLKAGDTLYIVNGTTASIFTIESVTITDEVLYPGGYRIVLSGFFPIDDNFTTDILYTIGGEDKIVCMYTDTNIQYNVLTSSQVIGGLNFDKNSLIHSAHIANSVVSFPDGTNNEPRKINIESAIKANYSSFVTDSQAYTFPLNFDEITLIKRPPTYTPNFSKDYDNTFLQNFIANESFEFAFQYQYYDSETSVVGSYSPSSRLNPLPIAPTTTTNNRIIVTMDYSEFIPNTVKIVNLIVRSSDTNYAFIVRTWDKSYFDDEYQILAHNFSINPLTYDFYNDKNGIVLAEADVLRPFDNVPIYSQTHSIAKQRYFLANNINSYDTPITTSMNLNVGSTIIPNDFASLTQDLFLVWHGGTYNFGGITNVHGYKGWFVYLSWADKPGYYLCTGFDISSSITTNPPTPAAPTTIVYSTANLVYKGKTLDEVVQNTNTSGFPTNFREITQTGSVTITGITLSSINVFPQLSTYQSGIAFYDYAMRKCGVVTNKDCVISTIERDYDGSAPVVDSFGWSVSNVYRIDEIPDWAYYYAPLLTKNLTKRFFIQSFTNTAKYFSKNADGTYSYSDTNSATSIGIALNTLALVQAGLGYIYAEGDLCILTEDLGTSTYDYHQLSVTGQDSNYILIQFKDLGSLASKNFVYEIYTPYKSSTQEPYYEMGEIYAINNPKTPNRSYSVLSGFFNADSYMFTRTWNGVSYLAQAMSPNDLFYKNWYTDTGKVNIITKLGQVDNNTEVVWSDTYISGTQINGSSTFRLGSQTFVSDDCGSITKLQNTSKVQDQGSVMLALCATETNSMYLGETQITDSTGGVQFFSSGTDVIGTINILKGNYGCIDPASVVQYRGNVYFLDVSNGRWVQYSANGLDTISAIKMTRFWKNWCYKYMSLTKDEIEAFGNRPYVFATVDPSHDELLITIPKLDDTPPKGFLPDYPLIVYPFDILDYQGKTISYKLGTGAIVQPHWQSAFSFNTEYFCTIQNRLFTFNEGNAWEHNQDNQNVFFGVYSPSQIMFTSNILPQMPKVYDNFLSESNIVPNFVYFYNEFPYLQTSDLEDISFVQKEGIWYAQILRNKVVPTTTGDVYTGLLTAEVMRNTNMFVLAEYSPTTSPLQLRILELGMSISRGHIV
jgi:uncharacterized protein (TIGR02145 family)